LRDRIEVSAIAEAARAHRVQGLWGYVHPIGVAPGGRVTVHATLEASAEAEVIRLGRTAILQGGGPEALRRDRDDVTVLARAAFPRAQPQVTRPGSYAVVGGAPIISPEVTLAAWIRPWVLPYRETSQWYAAGIITDLDYPDACRFGMLLDRRGHLCAYAGDGGTFDHARLLRSRARLADRLGQWSHVACAFGPRGVSLWIDGALDLDEVGPPVSGTTIGDERARLRIGALAEAGLADGHIDADLSQPLVSTRPLSADEVARLVADRGRHPAGSLLDGPLAAEWPLDEEDGDTLADASGSGRDARIVNGATWEVGGPAFDARARALDYEPRLDPDRGHGIRFSRDDLLDCDWAAIMEHAIPEDAPSGFRAVRLRLSGMDWADGITVPFVVVRTAPSRPGSVCLVVPTNTWHAYGRRYEDVPVPAGLHSSFYTAHANGLPFMEIGLRMPIPRADPYGSDSARAARQGHSQLVRPERIADAWLRASGYAVECVTDLELHRGEVDLDAFACLMLAGHSEYWSDEMRGHVEAYLARGGRLLSLSGDTASQRVAISRGGEAIEARKIADAEGDPLWLGPERQAERWHPGARGVGGRFRSLGRPPWTMLGVSTKGMIDDGTITAFAPLRVIDPDHVLMREPERVPVAADGTIGSRSVNGPAVSGYEFDASPEVVGFRDAPLPGVSLIARAVDQPNIESIGGVPDVGADVIHWLRPAGGEVVAIASIGASGALVDEGVGTLVRNALHRFGASRGSPS
jgi:hypothetical protein